MLQYNYIWNNAYNYQQTINKFLNKIHLSSVNSSLCIQEKEDIV